jgi:hypothetical protein
VTKTVVIRDIKADEWRDFEWFDVTHLRSEKRTFARGEKSPPRPDDEFAYVLVRDPVTRERRWERVQMMEEV